MQLTSNIDTYAFLFPDRLNGLLLTESKTTKKTELQKFKEDIPVVIKTAAHPLALKRTAEGMLSGQATSPKKQKEAKELEKKAKSIMETLGISDNAIAILAKDEIQGIARILSGPPGTRNVKGLEKGFTDIYTKIMLGFPALKESEFKELAVQIAWATIAFIIAKCIVSLLGLSVPVAFAIETLAAIIVYPVLVETIRAHYARSGGNMAAFTMLETVKNLAKILETAASSNTPLVLTLVSGKLAILFFSSTVKDAVTQYVVNNEHDNWVAYLINVSIAFCENLLIKA